MKIVKIQHMLLKLFKNLYHYAVFRMTITDGEGNAPFRKIHLNPVQCFSQLVSMSWECGVILRDIDFP